MATKKAQAIKSEQARGFVRHGLTALAGLVAGAGGGDALPTTAGLILLVVGVAWSWLSKRERAKPVTAAAPKKPRKPRPGLPGKAQPVEPTLPLSETVGNPQG